MSSRKPYTIYLPTILEQALKQHCQNTRQRPLRAILLILTEYFRNYIIYHLGEPAYKDLIKKYSKTIDQDIEQAYKEIGLDPPNNQEGQDQNQKQGEPNNE